MTLQDAFAEVEDHRKGPAQRYDLKEMIVMAICAVLCGADGWVDIADWCEGEEDWLKTFLDLKNGTFTRHVWCGLSGLGRQDVRALLSAVGVQPRWCG